MIARIVCLLLIVLSMRARADAPLPTALHWVRAPGAEKCLDGRTAAQRVESLTGPVFVRPADAERSLEVQLSPQRRGFRARIVSVTESGTTGGERVLTTPDADCRGLEVPLAFVLALTIDPELARAGVPDEVLALFGEETPPEETLLSELNEHPPAPVILPEPEPHPEAEAPPTADVVRAPPAPPRARTHATAALGAALIDGLVPRWTPGLEASVRLHPPRFLAFGVVVRAFPRGARSELSGGGAARFQAYSAAAALCPLDLGTSVLHLEGCFGPELAYVYGRGERYGRNQSDGLWDPAAFAELLLAVRLGKGVQLYARAVGRVRVTSQRFVYRQGDGSPQTAFDPARFAPIIALGAARAF